MSTIQKELRYGWQTFNFCCHATYLQAQQEVDRVMGERQQPTMRDYTELKYVMRCVNESMRLYPHPPVLLRRAMVQDQLPGDCLCLRLPAS